MSYQDIKTAIKVRYNEDTKVSDEVFDNLTSEVIELWELLEYILANRMHYGNN